MKGGGGKNNVTSYVQYAHRGKIEIIMFKQRIYLGYYQYPFIWNENQHTRMMKFDRKRHIQYFLMNLKKLPRDYIALDSNRLTLVHFSVQSLELLNFFDNNDNAEFDKNQIIEWIYHLQTKSLNGFKGGTSESHDLPHLAMTYSALSSLITLGDDLERIDKKKITTYLKRLQRQDGSFSCVEFGSETDMRFLYCAIAISYILNDFSGVNLESAFSYIQSCLSYEGGFSLIPMQESHGGSTFCAVASLELMGQLERFFEVNVGSKNNLVQWCLSRQIEGLQGRTNKLEDTCYSFWIGASLNILDEAHELLDKRTLDDFVFDCQTCLGGFSKLRGSGNSYPDLLHSFYSLCWLSISSSSGNTEEISESSFKLKALNAPLGLPDSQNLKSYLGTRYN